VQPSQRDKLAGQPRFGKDSQAYPCQESEAIGAANVESTAEEEEEITSFQPHQAD